MLGWVNSGDRGQHERCVTADEEGGSAVGTFLPLLERREEGGVRSVTGRSIGWSVDLSIGWSSVVLDSPLVFSVCVAPVAIFGLLRMVRSAVPQKHYFHNGVACPLVVQPVSRSIVRSVGRSTVLIEETN